MPGKRKTMVSDCGNEISSVKFKIWMHTYSNSGTLEVAFDPAHRPAGTRRDDWKEDFNSFYEMESLMLNFTQRIEDYNRREQERPRKHATYCENCNTIRLDDPPYNELEIDYEPVCTNCIKQRLDQIRRW